MVIVRRKPYEEQIGCLIHIYVGQFFPLIFIKTGTSVQRSFLNKKIECMGAYEGPHFKKFYGAIFVKEEKETRKGKIKKNKHRNE